MAAVAAAALLAALLPAAAVAKGRDRNHDKLPDRWERAHGLSLNVKQARRDQDRDGLRNLAEYRHGTDPRDADSDDDGLDDGDEVAAGRDPGDDRDENAGTVVSFDGTTLTISLDGGGTLVGAVVDGVTEIECEDEGGDGDHGGGDDRRAYADDGGSCTAAALQPGTPVAEAELHGSGPEAVFEKVKL